MARQEFHSDTLKVEQKAPVTDDPSQYDGEIVVGEKIGGNTAFLEELAFMDEPVTIRIEPSADKNAAGAFPVWVNGKGAEVFEMGRWNEIGYLPVGQVITVKRKVLEVIIRAKTDNIQTVINEMDSERPRNVIQRFTSPVHSFSIIEDRNPRGPAWVTELRRRNF